MVAEIGVESILFARVTKLLRDASSLLLPARFFPTPDLRGNRQPFTSPRTHRRFGSRSDVLTIFSGALTTLLLSIAGIALVLLIFFALPTAGISVGPVQAGLIALVLNTAVFNCEVWRTALPGLINEMSQLVKLTPVLAVVGVVDITRAAVRIGAQTYEPLSPFLVALGIYIPIVHALVSAQRWVERRTLQREAAA
jgi:ABC-type amino acid transport system permease subunit